MAEGWPCPALNLIGWYAQSSEIGTVTADDFVEQLTEEAGSVEPLRLLTALAGHGATLLRVLARVQGVRVEELVRDLAKSGSLAHDNLEFGDGLDAGPPAHP